MGLGVDLLSTVRNADSVNLTRGMVVRFSAGVNRQVVRAQADSASHLQGYCGVVASGSVAPGGSVVIAPLSASVAILLETGLTPVAGETLYISGTVAGRATNVAPATAAAVGTISDNSNYSRTSIVNGVIAPAFGTSSSSESSIDSVATVADLALLDGAGFGNGDTWCYVQTYKAYFCAVASTQAAAANVRVAVLNKPGFMWCRVVESTAWWSQLTWYVDPVSGNDEAAGSIGVPLKTFAELSRRFRGRNLPGTETNSFVVNLLTDCPDTDYPQFHLGSNFRNAPINVTVAGTVLSTVAVGTVASAVARNAAANTANSITVTGFDFSPYVGKIVRLVSTPTTLAVIEATPSLGVAQLSEREVAGTITGNFAAGDVVQIPICTKVPGFTAEGVGIQGFITDCIMDPIGSIGVSAPGANIVTRRVELRGTTTGVWNCTSANLLNGTSISRSQQFNCLLNGTGFAMTTGVTVSVPASPQRHHLASCGGNNARIDGSDGAIIRFNGDFHMFNLAAAGFGIGIGTGGTAYFASKYYGSGNDAGSAGLVIKFGSSVFYPTAVPPTMNSALGLVYDSDGTVAGGTSLAFGSLPLAFTGKLCAMVQI